MIHHVWRGNFWRYNDILKNNSIKSVQEFIGLMQPVGALSEREKQTVDAESKSSVQFSSVTRSCPTLCDPMNHSTPGLPVHHQLPEFTQTHVHWVSDAIQPSHPLSSLSPSALNFSQHQGLFKWISSSHQVAKVLEFQLQNQSYQWTHRTEATKSI